MHLTSAAVNSKKQWFVKVIGFWAVVSEPKALSKPHNYYYY